MPEIVCAPAKLTVSLKITGIRADGYHFIDAEMVSLELADVLTFTDGEGISVSGPAAAGVPTDERNLVAKALRLVDRQAHVHIDKHIRAQGGLGGGSSDAAAVLRWAGCHDQAVAAALGADVPFCVRGGRGRVTGIGEIIEALPPMPRAFTLVTPPFGVSTVEAFAAWDALRRPVLDGPNDLEGAACAVEPRLTEWFERVEVACGHRPRLAGSGSTLFLDGAYPDLVGQLTDATVVVTRAIDANQPPVAGG